MPVLNKKSTPKTSCEVARKQNGLAGASKDFYVCMRKATSLPHTYTISTREPKWKIIWAESKEHNQPTDLRGCQTPRLASTRSKTEASTRLRDEEAWLRDDMNASYTTVTLYSRHHHRLANLPPNYCTFQIPPNYCTFQRGIYSKSVKITLDKVWCL